MHRSLAPAVVSAPIVLAAVATGLLAAAVPAAAQPAGNCRPSPNALCLLDDRFRVEVEWKDFDANPLRPPGRPGSGVGKAVDLPGTVAVDDGGYFFFTDPDKVDLLIRALDGRGINGHFWVFYGSLTNVEFELTVVDTQTDVERVYTNPPGASQAILDTQAFATIPGSSTVPRASGSAAPEPRRVVILPSSDLPDCAATGVTCIQDDRIALEIVQARDVGPVSPINQLVTDSSLVAGFGPGGGPDVGVKVIDPIQDELWLFGTSTPIDDVRLTVTDLTTGRSASYESSSNSPIAVAERTPFAPDPPSDAWLTTPAIPGFRFQVRVTDRAREIATRQEADCVPETLCISGAIPGRSELFLRIPGPKANGFLHANVVKFSTSRIEVWAEQLATGQINYYDLARIEPGSSELAGYTDRRAFAPTP